MLVYILIFFLLLFPVKKKRINNWCFFILILFTIIRWDIGWDYREYYFLAQNNKLDIIPLFLKKDSIYEYSNLIGSLGYLRGEFLLKVICKIIWKLKLPAQTIIIFYGVIILYFLKKGLDNLKIYNKYVWLWFYSFPYFYFSSLSMMRQWAAISITFYSSYYLKEKKYIKYIFFLFIAGLFHKTALLFLIVFLIKEIEIKKWIYVLLFIISFKFQNIFKFIVLNIDFPVINDYKAYVIDTIGSGGSKMFYLVLILFIIILLRIIHRKHKIVSLEEKLCFIGCFIFISLINLGHLSIRMSMYYLIYSLCLVNDISIKNNRLVKKMMVFVAMCLLIATLINDQIRNDRSELVPYQTIFQEKKLIK